MKKFMALLIAACVVVGCSSTQPTGNLIVVHHNKHHKGKHHKKKHANVSSTKMGS